MFFFKHGKRVWESHALSTFYEEVNGYRSALFFSYVRDATVAIFISFSLFVFPSQRPVFFAPDRSGELFSYSSHLQAWLESNCFIF